MDQSFGMPVPGAHSLSPHRAHSRYLVLIDSGGVATALLFTAEREQVAEFDASCEEAALMIRGLVPAKGAAGAEWDRALQGHALADRRAAEVYTLQL